MKRFFATLAAVLFWAPVLADEVASKANGQAPLMVSFTDLKWTELPERKGMQFALLSGDPKKGEYTQMRKVPAGTDNPLHAHSSEIKNVIIGGVWYTGADAASIFSSADARASGLRVSSAPVASARYSR